MKFRRRQSAETSRDRGERRDRGLSRGLGIGELLGGGEPSLRRIRLAPLGIGQLRLGAGDRVRCLLELGVGSGELARRRLPCLLGPIAVALGPLPVCGARSRFGARRLIRLAARGSRRACRMQPAWRVRPDAGSADPPARARRRDRSRRARPNPAPPCAVGRSSSCGPRSPKGVPSPRRCPVRARRVRAPPPPCDSRPSSVRAKLATRRGRPARHGPRSPLPARHGHRRPPSRTSRQHPRARRQRRSTPSPSSPAFGVPRPPRPRRAPSRDAVPSPAHCGPRRIPSARSRRAPGAWSRPPVRPYSPTCLLQIAPRAI